MKDDVLVVSTWYALILLRPFTGDYAVLVRGEGYNWGITWSEKFLMSFSWIGLRTVLRLFDRTLQRVKDMDMVNGPRRDIIAPHQIIWKDDNLWVANTQYDYFDVMDLQREWTIWRCDPDNGIYKGEKRRGNDNHHYNGIWFNEDKAYVVAHNKGNNSFVNEYSYPSMEFIRKIENCGSLIHNIFPVDEEGNLGVCDSGGKGINYLGGVQMIETGGFPRGVAITSRYNYVGVSPHHWACKHRNTVDGELHVYDKDWKLAHVCVLRGFGQVYEVRALHARDEAHYDGSEIVFFDYSDLPWQGPEQTSNRIKL